MAQGRGNAVIVALALFALLQLVAAKDYIVGDDTEWDIPADPSFYDTWTSKQAFVPGDKLVFKYGAGMHDMQVVSAAEYAGCMMSNAVKYTSGSDTITLSKAGDYHFLCTFVGHCEQGMKLKVTVKAGAATPPAVAPATPPTATPPVTTPPSAPRPATPPVRAPAPAPVVRTPAPAPVVRTPAPAPVPAIAPVPTPVTVPTPAPEVAATPPAGIVPETPAATPEPQTSSAQATSRVCLSLLVVSAAVFGVLSF